MELGGWFVPSRGCRCDRGCGCGTIDRSGWFGGLGWHIFRSHLPGLGWVTSEPMGPQSWFPAGHEDGHVPGDGSTHRPHMVGETLRSFGDGEESDQTMQLEHVSSKRGHSWGTKIVYRVLETSGGFNHNSISQYEILKPWAFLVWHHWSQTPTHPPTEKKPPIQRPSRDRAYAILPEAALVGGVPSESRGTRPVLARGRWGRLLLRMGLKPFKTGA